MIAVSYLVKRKTNKVFLDVISKTKIFNINFSMKLPTTKILLNLQGGLDNAEYDNLIQDSILLVTNFTTNKFNKIECSYKELGQTENGKQQTK